MPNLAAALKEEIARLARREINRETATLQNQSAQYRRDIAALKRDNTDLTRRLAFLEKQEKKRINKMPSEDVAANARFSPKWVAAHREKVGLSAQNYGTLVGVSGLTIYNWEKGKSKPRQQQLAMWVAVRGLGKREAQQQLEMVGG